MPFVPPQVPEIPRPALVVAHTPPPKPPWLSSAVEQEPPRAFWTVPEVAAHFRVSERLIWSQVKREEIACVRIGRTVRISDSEVRRIEEGS